MNTIKLIGRLTKDATLDQTAGGKTVAKFTIASNRGRNSKNADFIQVVAWEEIAGQASSLLKADFVKISGSLRTRKFEKDGMTHFTSEVVAHKIEKYEQEAA